ncbi:putative C6 transcription factor [Achaetomium macrosporum]|uniref:C6 transcription factor n=1 Tax=Achaetomium macrosporum TaxID=79813 RepID=A0AAN7H8B1_9PEZI|nr:putative C6 transcription factor [Achaetomium macrosporum]
MPLSCRTCARRKVKCDKAAPSCSACRKSKLECSYESPHPRERKRKLLSSELLERLARYEHVLRQHGLLESAQAGTSASGHVASTQAPDGSISLLWDEPEDTGMTGKLVTTRGGSRYVSSLLWQNLEYDEAECRSESEDFEDDAAPYDASDPLTVAMMDARPRRLHHYHPAPFQARLLWAKYIENVEPLCKMLHIPSTTNMIEATMRRFETASNPDDCVASRAEECLLFAIYHFAVFSMTDDECLAKLENSRAVLLQRYHLAARQALVNAFFLKTTEFTVLQALVLFLLSSQHSYDPSTYWVLTGAAVRIAQRIGLHRDGERLGLPPFEVEMRRRLFYQLLPLEARASQTAAMGISTPPYSWNVRPPLNINDDQIWPGMAETPQEQKGATEMIFCLSRACLGSFFLRSARPGNGSGAGGGLTSWHLKDAQESERIISQAESEAEEKFIRYCDVVNPLHFLTICTARSGVTAMRLRVKLAKVRSQSATDADARDAFQLALKILDTDSAVCAHPGIERYRWHIKPFMLWGTWDASVFIVTTLAKGQGMPSPREADAAWETLKSMHRNHDQLYAPHRPLYASLRRLTMRAWEVNPPSWADDIEKTGFIDALRSDSNHGDQDGNKLLSQEKNRDTAASALVCHGSGAGPNLYFALGHDFDPEGADWSSSWEHFVREQAGQEQYELDFEWKDSYMNGS